MKRLLLIVSVFVISISFTGNSIGATSNAFISVQTEVDVVCVITGADLVLGAYTGSAINLISGFDVQCTDTTLYTISYGEGSNFLGGLRRLSDVTTNYLDYSLFCEDVSGGGIDIECGNGSTIGFESTGTGSGLVQPFGLEAYVPPGQFVPAGTYWDDITVTLTY